MLPVLEREHAQVRLHPGGVEPALATADEAQREVDRGLLVDTVVGQGTAVRQLLPRVDETLLGRRDSCEDPRCDTG